VKRIPLIRAGVVVGHTVVDDDDYPRLAQWTWHVSDENYVVRYEHGPNDEGIRVTRCVRMHREVVGLEPDDPLRVDHKDGDPLNNRRENLRQATNAQNHQNRRLSSTNTSGYRGVSLLKRTGRWGASVVLAGERHWLGYHDTAEQAGEIAAEFRRQHMPYSKEGAA